MDQGGSESVFSATAVVNDDHLRVVVRGEVDMSTADTMVQSAVRQRADRVVLDLRGVTFFDSAAIHAVMQLARRFPGALTVLPSRRVRRVLDISGLADQPWVGPDGSAQD